VDAPPQTGDRLMAVARRVRRAHLDALADWQVTPSQARALKVLARADGMRPSALAAELQIAPRSATEVADALEGRGWLRRRADPADRRATVLTLTGSGQDLVAAIEDVRRRASEAVLDVLTPAQRRTLHDILGTVLGNEMGEGQ
jgi:DNA-binding MarR family transcriptional regulator